jgi:hypothetical protein
MQITIFFQMKSIKHYLLLIFLLVVIVLLIWNRLRARIDIKIPIENIKTVFFIWLILCCIILIIAIILVIMVQQKKTHTFVEKYIDMKFIFKRELTKVLSTLQLDMHFRKSLKYFAIHNKVLIYWYCISLSIKVLLLILFTIDVCYFNQIHYFFKMLPLLIFPLCTNIYLRLLEHSNRIDWPRIDQSIQICISTPGSLYLTVIHLEEYLNIAVSDYLKNLPQTECVIGLTPEFREYSLKQSPGKKINYKLTREDFKNALRRLTLRHSILYTFNEQKIRYTKRIRILSYSLYFLNYLYIIYVSDSTLFNSISFYIFVEEPFSGMFF